MTTIQFTMLLLACLLAGPLAAYAFAVGFARGILVGAGKGIHRLASAGNFESARPLLAALSETHIRPMVDAAVERAIDVVLSKSTQQPGSFAEEADLYFGHFEVPSGTQRFRVRKFVDIDVIGRAPTIVVSPFVLKEFDERTAPRIVIDSVTVDGVEIYDVAKSMILYNGVMRQALPPGCVYAGEIVISGCVVSSVPLDALVSVSSIVEDSDNTQPPTSVPTEEAVVAYGKETYIGKQYCNAGDNSFHLDSEAEFIHLKKTAKLIATVVRRGPRDGRLIQIRITELNIGIADVVGYTNAGYMAPIEDPLCQCSPDEGLEVYDFDLSIPENLLFGPISLDFQYSGHVASTVKFSLVQS